MRYGLNRLLLGLFIYGGLPLCSQVYVTKPFGFTGSMTTFTVPGCVTSITADVRGAQGGGANNGPGGFGGRSQAVINVTPGEVLEIWVGGAGTYTTNALTGGFNGGGGHTSQGFGGTGGGASDIRRGGGLTDRIIVAGGGGGGTDSEQENRPGGAGGGLSGGTGTAFGTFANSGGKGGSQIAGGNEGAACCYTATAGSFGLGGSGGGDLAAGCGGGGGWYGGGGGLFGGGGGGSGYFDNGTLTNTIATPGFQEGNGIIYLTYTVLPVNVAASPSAICSGSSTTLTASGMTSYTWMTGMNAVAPTVTLSPASSAIYSIEATSPLGCPAAGTVAVQVTQGIPDIGIQQSASQICPGESIVLTASGADNLTWSHGVTNGTAFQPTASAIYTVTGNNVCGASSSAIEIVVHNVTLNATANATAICAGQSVTLQPQGTAVSYTWSGLSPAGGIPAVVVSPTATTVYTLNGENDFGCAEQAQLTIVVNLLPNVSAAANSTSVCQHSALTMTASGAASYTWLPVQVNTATVALFPTASTVYSVTGESAAGCSSQATLCVIVNPVPVFQAAATKTFVCANTNVTLKASGASSYQWSTGQTSSQIVVTPSVPTTYTVTGFGSNGCSKTKTLFVDVMAPPYPYTVPASTTVCKGSELALYAPYGGSYSWSNGETTQSITVKPYKNSVYTFAASVYSNGITCSLSGTIKVVVVNNPAVYAHASPKVICEGQQVILSASGANNYSWHPGGAGQSVTVTPTKKSYKFKVTGTDSNGCEGHDEVAIKVNTCTSVEELGGADNYFAAYPNPSNGSFILSATRTMQIRVINGLGQLIAENALDEKNDFAIRFDGLASGVYVVYGIAEGQTGVRKIMVE